MVRSGKYWCRVRKDEIKSMPDAVARDGYSSVTSLMVVLWVRKI